MMYLVFRNELQSVMKDLSICVCKDIKTQTSVHCDFPLSIIHLHK